MSLGQSKDGVFERNTWVFVLTASWSRRVYILLYRYILYILRCCTYKGNIWVKRALVFEFYFFHLLFTSLEWMDFRDVRPKKPICLVSKTDRNKQILFAAAAAGGSTVCKTPGLNSNSWDEWDLIEYGINAINIYIDVHVYIHCFLREKYCKAIAIPP